MRSKLTRTLIEIVVVVPPCVLAGYLLVPAAGVVMEGIREAQDRKTMKYDGDVMVRMFAMLLLLISGVWLPIFILVILENHLVGNFDLDAIVPNSFRNIVASIPQYLVLVAGWCAVLAGIVLKLRNG